MSGKILLHTTCKRKFSGNGCRWCNLRLVCDRSGFVPQGHDHPPLEGQTPKRDCFQPSAVGGGDGDQDVPAPVNNAAG